MKKGAGYRNTERNKPSLNVMHDLDIEHDFFVVFFLSMQLESKHNLHLKMEHLRIYNLKVCLKVSVCVISRIQ